MKKISAPDVRAAKARGEKLAVLTAYDATFARLLDAAGADVLLVGDSLGMVVQGLPNTLPVTLDDMIYHTRAVARVTRRAHVVTDMPFLSFQVSPEDALRAAGRLVKEGGAEAVKLEGGARSVEAVRRIVEAGIPVMGHVGLLPQSVHEMGGFKVQAREAEAQKTLLADAQALVAAGVYALVVEGVPSDVAAELTRAVSVPTIGIGAGPSCDGQVLVCYDFLGMFGEFKPKFVKRYAELGEQISQATANYVREVKAGVFPDAAHSFAPAPKAMTGGAETKYTLTPDASEPPGYGPAAEEAGEVSRP
ncbi:MAG: 3-methyl-2-oxobutanoate hydroxymethyltransferase [Pseudomonadota bacterium]|jgi:3-methyl-2-oxobutanoate hydroxymethyltransferase